MAHAAAGLFAGAGRDHLVVGEQRAVEQNNVGAGEVARAAPAGRRPRPARKTSARAAGRELHADIAPVSAASSGRLAFEIERDLAGHREQLGFKAAGERESASPEHDGAPRDDIGCQSAEHRIGCHAAKVSSRREQRKGLPLAQRQQARDLVDLGTGQDDGGDRAAAQAGARLQRRRRRQSARADQEKR